MAKTKKKTVFRSSVTGKFVKGSYAKKHKRTTEKQHERISKKHK